jgi:hypothetical protein
MDRCLLSGSLRTAWSPRPGRVAAFWARLATASSTRQSDRPWLIRSTRRSRPPRGRVGGRRGRWLSPRSAVPSRLASLVVSRADAIEISVFLRAVTSVATTTCVWTWPGWYHYRISWSLGRPFPTWGHAGSRRYRLCRVPTRLSCGRAAYPFLGHHQVVAFPLPRSAERIRSTPSQELGSSDLLRSGRPGGRVGPPGPYRDHGQEVSIRLLRNLLDQRQR